MIQVKIIYQISLGPTHYCYGDALPIFEDKDGDGEIRQNTDPQTNEVIDRYYYYSRRDLCDSTEEPLARPNPVEWGDAFGLRWKVCDPYELEYIDENHYRCNSKEWDRISEWYDYGWRWYDPVIGRRRPERLVEGWSVVNPLACDFPSCTWCKFTPFFRQYG